MRSIAQQLGWRLHFYTADVSDDLPDFFVGHADALTVGSVRRHDCAGNAIADHLKQLRVIVRVLFPCPRQVRTAAAAMRPESVAERAVDTELILARLRGFCVAREGIAIVGSISSS